MGNQVIKLSATAQEELIASYRAHSVNPPPHARFSAKTPQCVITVYNSGKVMFQGRDADTEAAKWGTSIKKEPSVPKNVLPEGFSDWSV
ncbi:MAG: DUF3378 domain-containing protein, partial [Exiguobacterium chiriqhucha]